MNHMFRIVWNSDIFNLFKVGFHLFVCWKLAHFFFQKLKDFSKKLKQCIPINNRIVYFLVKSNLQFKLLIKYMSFHYLEYFQQNLKLIVGDNCGTRCVEKNFNAKCKEKKSLQNSTPMWSLTNLHSKFFDGLLEYLD